MQRRPQLWHIVYGIFYLLWDRHHTVLHVVKLSIDSTPFAPSVTYALQLILFIFLSLYYQSYFRRMYQRSQGVGISENFRHKIATVIKHHLIMPNLFAVVSVLYTISSESVKIGDPFTFPFVDALPIKKYNCSTVQLIVDSML
jgi:hypothetical protein